MSRSSRTHIVRAPLTVRRTRSLVTAMGLSSSIEDERRCVVLFDILPQPSLSDKGIAAALRSPGRSSGGTCDDVSTMIGDSGARFHLRCGIFCVSQALESRERASWTTREAHEPCSSRKTLLLSRSCESTQVYQRTRSTQARATKLVEWASLFVRRNATRAGN